MVYFRYLYPSKLSKVAKRNKKKIIENVEITDIGSEGKALGKINDQVIFVPSLIPGDVVDIQVKRKRRSYLEGMPVYFRKYSEWRIPPFCKHFGTCGGCKWQHLPYERQLYFKEKQVVDALVRIGKLNIENKHPILASQREKYYRNKLEFTFSATRWLSASEIESGTNIEDRRALGFHVAGMFNRVLNIEECYLQPAPSNELRNVIRNYAIDHGFSFFNQSNNEGLLRNVIIRTASTHETMVILVFHYEDIKNEKLLQYVSTKFPDLTSVMYVINPKVNDSITDLDVHLFKGRDYIVEQMGNLRFRIGPKSFYQTNSDQAHRLYKVVHSFASFQGDEIVYDLYTGTGTIANFIASHVDKVIGIEYVPETVEDAKKNARLNRIKNVSFISGDIKSILSGAFALDHGHPDVIITDPPRAGMHKDVVGAIQTLAPEKIVYVSCNPATQARDIALLSDTYTVKEIQPVDMFPHTHHVENVALLRIKQN